MLLYFWNIKQNSKNVIFLKIYNISIEKINVVFFFILI